MEREVWVEDSVRRGWGQVEGAQVQEGQGGRWRSGGEERCRPGRRALTLVET